MKTNPEINYIKLLEKISETASIIVFVFGLFGLIKNIYYIKFLKNIFANIYQIHPLTAINFLLIGLSMYLLQIKRENKKTRMFALICSILVFTFSLSIFSENIFRMKSIIKQLFFTGNKFNNFITNPIVLRDTFNFFIISVSLFLLAIKNRFCDILSQVLIMMAGIISMIFLGCYIYDISFFHFGKGIRINVSLYDSLTFMIIFIGTLLIRTSSGLISLFTSNSLGGTILRRILPISIIVPLLLNWLVLIGERNGIYDNEFGLVLVTIGIIIIVTTYVYWFARSLDKSDIERKQILVALKDSEKKYRQFIELAQEGVWVVDIETKTTFVNPKMAEMLGYKMEEMLSKSLGFFMKEKYTDLNEFYMDRRKKGIIEQYDFEFTRKDGKSIYTILHASPVHDKEGNFTGAIAFVSDITERRHAEEKLIKLKKAVEASGEAIFMTDKDGIITYVNPEFTNLYGFTAKEVINKTTPRILKSGVLKEQDYTSFWKTLLSNQVIKGELINKTKDGKLLNIESCVNPILDNDADIIGFLAVQRDITNRKKTEEEKDKLQAQLLQAQKIEAVGTLTGGIAHDFNNILTVILGNIQLAMTKVNQDDILYKYLSEVFKFTRHASDIVRQLLLFSRKHATVELVNVNLNKSIDNVMKMLNRLIGEDINIKTELDNDLSFINADVANIEQVILNLAINARDAMQNGGEIIIKTKNVIINEEESKIFPDSKPGKFVCLVVEDTGRGMTSEIMSHIFEPFFTTKEVGKGTGLGLSVVYGIVRQHKGWINVYSEPEHGTTFKVYFPVIHIGKVDEDIEMKDMEDLQGNNNRILFVEDEEGIRKVIYKILNKNRYVIFTASNVKEALEIFNKENGNFDLVFSDIIMPDKNGLQLADELLCKKPDIKILLGSGYTDEKYQSSIIKERNLKFIQKPYEMNNLLKTIKQIIDI